MSSIYDCFLQFRYTLPEGDSNPRKYMHLLQVLLGDIDDYYATCGFEEKNKLNQPTHPHIHIHVACNGRTVGAARKAFQRWAKQMEETRKGNALYALSNVDDIVDVNRWLRYAWKQGGRKCTAHGFAEKLPDHMDVDLEIALAIEEQERMWEFNCKKQEEQLRPNTKDKLFEYLMEQNTLAKFENKKQILIKILDYYNQEDKSANKQTIMGYLQTALWKFGLETVEQTALEWLK